MITLKLTFFLHLKFMGGLQKRFDQLGNQEEPLVATTSTEAWVLNHDKMRTAWNCRDFRRFLVVDLWIVKKYCT